MKKIKVKSYILCIIIILISSPIISSSSVLTDNAQTDTINELSIQLETNEKITQAVENVTESLLREYLEELVAIGPRRTGNYGCDIAAEYLYQKFGRSQKVIFL